MKLLLHPEVETALAAFADTPSHALIVVGPRGSGKDSLVHRLSATLLAVEVDDLDKKSTFRTLQPIDDKSLGIETVGELIHFMSLRSPQQPQAINRIAYLPAAELMTREAQNALLKLLEEPPVGSLIILSATNEQALLPTIVSRSQTLYLRKPDPNDLKTELQTRGHDSNTIDQAMRIGGGWAGLTTALLEQSADHPLSQAAQTARQLLSGTAYDRLLLVDNLARQRPQAIDTCYILQQMAQMSLRTTTDETSARWQRILQAGYNCQQALLASANAKLALTELMVSL
jgi:replication-associated recombination protein RarA